MPLFEILLLVIGITLQTHRRDKHCLSALAEQASFAEAKDPNTGFLAAVPDLPPANCPPLADRTSTARPYGSFETLQPQSGAAFSC